MKNRTLLVFAGIVVVAALSLPSTTYAQSPPTTATGSAAAQDDDPDMDPNDAQPDFFLATIPTTLRLPKHKLAFRITHRFGRQLGQGDFGDLLADAFGFDSGAQMGFGLNYAPFSGAQLGFYRTSDRTIQFTAAYQAVRQRGAMPVSINIVGSAEGTNNFRDSYSPGVQAVISREVNDRAALYIAPAWVNNSNPQPTELVDDNDTIMIGLGGRLRLSKNTYVFLEGSPRTGYAPGANLVSFGIERRAGGHLFSLTFSNGFGTTLAQAARGGTAKDDWYIGFNLSRKFF